MLQKASKITTLIVCFSFLASSLAFSQDFDDKEGPGKRHRKYQNKRGMHFGNPEKMKEILDLNDDQIIKIKKINEEYKSQFEDLRAKIKPEKKKLRELLKKETINLNEVKSQLEKIAMIKVEIRLTRIKQRLAIEKILTPEQLKKYKEEKRKKRKHRRRNHD